MGSAVFVFYIAFDFTNDFTRSLRMFQLIKNRKESLS